MYENGGLTKSVEVHDWMSKYIPLIYSDIIAYPCPNPIVGLGDSQPTSCIFS